MVFAAMLPWQLFATSLSEGSGSLINNANLISKVYFPRLIVPAGAIIVSFVDFAIAMVLLGVLMSIHHVAWLAGADASGLYLSRAPRFGWRGHLARGLKRQISRLPLRRAVHRPVWALHFARRLQQRDRAGKMASVFRPATAPNSCANCLRA